MTGTVARADLRMNSTIATTAIAKDPSVRPLDQSHVGPSTRARDRAPMAHDQQPATADVGGDAGLGAVTVLGAQMMVSARAMSPTGMLITKIHRQED